MKFLLCPYLFNRSWWTWSKMAPYKAVIARSIRAISPDMTDGNLWVDILNPITERLAKEPALIDVSTLLKVIFFLSDLKHRSSEFVYFFLRYLRIKKQFVFLFSSRIFRSTLIILIKRDQILRFWMRFLHNPRGFYIIIFFKY